MKIKQKGVENSAHQKKKVATEKTTTSSLISDLFEGLKPPAIIATQDEKKMDKSESRAILISMGLSDEDIHLLETGTIEQKARMFTKRGYPMGITEKITIGDHSLTRTYQV